MRQHFKLFTILLFGTSVASSAFAAFELTAHAGALPASAHITLSRHDIDQRSTTRLLETRTESDGSLELPVEEEAGIFVLKVDEASQTTLAVAANESVALSLQVGAIETRGSPGTKILKNYEAFRKESLARLVYPIRGDIKKAKERNAAEDEIIRLTQAEVDAYEAHVHELNDFVIENAGDSMALYGSSLRLDGDYRLDELAEQVEAFSQRHGDIAASVSLNNRIQTARAVAIGSVAPQLQGTNLDGNLLKLSDYRGRYILVDFWASWCPPCRLENQHYLKLVNSIDHSRFDIFAVNLDTNKQAWSRAVSRDQASWIHLSDLQGWTSPLAAAYAVSSLPSSFLLDPEGRIVAKNLRGSALDAKLAELGVL